MLVSLLQFGEVMAGSIHRIQGGGLSGIAGTIWDEEVKMMRGRLSGGLRLEDILPKLRTGVGKEIFLVDRDKDKQYFIGLTTVGGFNF
jgi:hypothetical protein